MLIFPNLCPSFLNICPRCTRSRCIDGNYVVPGVSRIAVLVRHRIRPQIDQVFDFFSCLTADDRIVSIRVNEFEELVELDYRLQ